MLDPVANEFFEDIEMPQAGTITVRLYVQDRWGARASTPATVVLEISETVLDSDKIVDQDSKYTEAFERGDLSTAALSMVGVAQGMNQQVLLELHSSITHSSCGIAPFVYSHLLLDCNAPPVIACTLDYSCVPGSKTSKSGYE